MSQNSNPYESPAADVVHETIDFGPIADKDLEKTRAIIKDAGQFWLAILLCILCQAVGAVIIGPWYGVRLMQWKGISKKYPKLLTPNSPAGSLPQRFQSAQWKLWVGLAVGLLLAILVFGLLLMVMALPANFQQTTG